jgi:hypothetical protein
MIYHYKDKLKDLSYTLKTPLQYSNEFTFIPLKIKNKDIIFQTPNLFVPYGIQENEKCKQYVMISFQNKDNDIYTNKFLQDLQYIYQLVNNKYKKKYQVNSFIKTYKDQSIMNIKLRENSIIFDNQKNKIDDIPIYGYCSFIIHIAGIWVSNNNIWFQFYILQSKIDNNISLVEYAFKDSISPINSSIPPPPPLPPPPSIRPASSTSSPIDKYKKMISLGIPSAAVNHKKQMEHKSHISSDMLLSVKLKKGTSTKHILKNDMNGFEPPSLDSLQLALRNLRNIIKGS